MTTVSTYSPLARGIETSRRPAARPGFFARIMKRLVAARQAQADREVEAILQRSGGRLTDDVERQLCNAEVARWMRG
ncbi:hypothetical protein [Propylenella binzhouense]|uniref:Uncharacterized protein n=1 Tax=Propylenella binzhouense TaxID=2555902 RepID=A0A964T6T1_9HYPH|nr:hypothetical protein [Propylenella binzhouense]MYZ49165.1 hypothetical protein [Propylenella binzhouense]